MVRQAHTYLVGAVSGTALIAAAVVAFVLLVSAQAFRDWPLTGLPDLNGGGGESSAVSGGKAVADSTPSGATGPLSAATGSAASKGVAKSPGGNGADQPGAFAGTPAANGPPTSGSPAEQPVGDPGSGSAPAASATPSASAPKKSPGPANGGGDQVSGGGGSSGSSTSGQVTGAVNETVTGVDEVTGGVLGETGVTKVTEEVVNGGAGPESTVGKTVDKVVDTVGGLLGGNG